MNEYSSIGCNEHDFLKPNLCILHLYIRSEKEKNDYYAQVNDLRVCVDHISNEKVLIII